jgi:hypothetical protein
MQTSYPNMIKLSITIFKNLRPGFFQPSHPLQFHPNFNRYLPALPLFHPNPCLCASKPAFWRLRHFLENSTARKIFGRLLTFSITHAIFSA